MSSGTNRRRSLRLSGYDYSRAGAYFVTICVHGRQCLLGNIVDDEMRINEYGKIVFECWNKLPHRFPSIELDFSVVMPNHLHGIIIIVGAGFPGPSGKTSARGEETSPLPRKARLGQPVAYFKYQSTKQINELRRIPGTKVWQRGFYDHIIRDDTSLNRIREYIATNPLRWHLDQENPRSQGRDEFDLWLASFQSRPINVELDNPCPK